MRYLGVDVGTKTVGVAISDLTNTICTPLNTIKFSAVEDAIDKIISIINDKKITDVVVGLPKNMDGTEGFASERSKNFKSLLESKVDIKVHMVDERLTTREAENILIDRDYSRSKRKEIIDGVAAVLILESFLKMKGD